MCGRERGELCHCLDHWMLIIYSWLYLLPFTICFHITACSAAMTWPISMSHMQSYITICHTIKGTVLDFGTFEVCKSKNFIERLAWVSNQVPKWKAQISMAWLPWPTMSNPFMSWHIETSWQPELHAKAYTPSLIPRPFPPPVTKWWHHWTCSLFGVYGFWVGCTPWLTC